MELTVVSDNKELRYHKIAELLCNTRKKCGKEIP